MSTLPQPRVQRGVPTGGQFAAAHRPQSDVSLDSQLDNVSDREGSESFPGLAPVEHLAATPNMGGQGRWLIEDAVTEEIGAPSAGATQTAFHIGGRPEVRARNLAAVTTYPGAGQETIDRISNELWDKPVTVLVASTSGDILAFEGRGRTGFLMAK